MTCSAQNLRHSIGDNIHKELSARNKSTKASKSIPRQVRCHQWQLAATQPLLELAISSDLESPRSAIRDRKASHREGHIGRQALCYLCFKFPQRKGKTRAEVMVPTSLLPDWRCDKTKFKTVCNPSPFSPLLAAPYLLNKLLKALLDVDFCFGAALQKQTSMLPRHRHALLPTHFSLCFLYPKLHRGSFHFVECQTSLFSITGRLLLSVNETCSRLWSTFGNQFFLPDNKWSDNYRLSLPWPPWPPPPATHTFRSTLLPMSMITQSALVEYWSTSFIQTS